MGTELQADILLRVDELIARQGSASPLDLGLDVHATLEIARGRTDLEPVFLVRFRSPSGKVRIEQIRAYAWPSQRIALRHLGYRAEATRLLRLEPRQAVPFPERFYSDFEDRPDRLEDLRLAERTYEEAMRRASASPGRTERDLVRLARAFRKLGEDVEIEMWIDAAARLSDLGHPVFAAKMLDHLRILVEKNRKIDPSMLARTVLSAADAGVLHGRLYEMVKSRISASHSPEAAVGFGLRVLRRLLCSGRALPPDFLQDLREAARRGNVGAFEALLDHVIVWAAGLAPFWNAARKRSSGREDATADLPELVALRRRLAEILTNAPAEEQLDIWTGIDAAMPELTAVGRLAVVELLLAMPTAHPHDGERLLGATLSLLGRTPRGADRERIEIAAAGALRRVVALCPDLLLQRAAWLDEALGSAAFDLTSFVAFSDLLADATGPVDLPAALPGLPAAWARAMAKALSSEEPEAAIDGAGGEEDGESGLSHMPMLALIAEALSLVEPAAAAELFAELGPAIATRLAGDLYRNVGLDAWERVLDGLHRLGPLGHAVTAAATARFIKLAGTGAAFANAAPLAHLLDGALLEAAGVSSSAQPPAPRSVPPRVAGVARAELRRAVRSSFHDPLASLVFWSLEGNTPAPALDYLARRDKPAPNRALSAALMLVGLAQRVRYSSELAGRALHLAKAIGDMLAGLPPDPGGATSESVESLRRGIELTHLHIDHRERLRPDAWPVPAIPGIDLPRHHRFVLFAWLFGRLDTIDAGSNHLVFERIAGATPLVRSGYGRLLPSRGAGEISPVFTNLCRSSFVRMAIRGDGPLEDVIVLRDPIELVRAFVVEAGLSRR